MTATKQQLQRRQIRTTLTATDQKMLDAVCVERGCKESAVVREALVKYLRHAISDLVIHQHSETTQPAQ
jgi:hypothetical protein